MKAQIINDDFRNHLQAEFWNKATVISDPPYNQNYHYATFSDRITHQEYTNLMRDAFAERKSVVIQYPEAIINLFGHLLGEVKEVVSWVYPSNTGKQSRLIGWWNCKPDFRAVGQPYKNPTDKRIAERIAQGKQARLYDWWEINQVKNVSKKDNTHPCPIPYELAERIVLTTTKFGDVVIDPFAGSGTVLLAAQNNGRMGIGFEIDESYTSYATELLNESWVKA